MNRRLFLGSLGAAAVIGVTGGYLVSRDRDEDDGDDDLALDRSASAQDPTIGTNAEVAGDRLPPVDVEDNDGNVVSTADLLGQPLVVNVWFSTCAPCKKELPEFATVHAELGDEVRFVGINPSDSPETNEEFAEARGVMYELLRDPNGAFTDAVGITAFPVTLFVRADGTIARQTGALDEEQLREYATELLGVNLSLNLIRGMVAAVNPCGFVLLPTYLFYFLGTSNRTLAPSGAPSNASSGASSLAASDPRADAPRASIGRALTVSAAVSAGFMVVFLVIGFVTDQITTRITDNAKYATAAIGATFVVLGAAMLFGYRLPFATPHLDAGGRDRTVRSMFVYGIAYAVASLGCTLPLFLTVLFGASRAHGVLAGVGNVVAYGLGMAMVVSVLTVALAAANVGLLRFLRSSMKYVEMLAGAFVLLSGAYLLWYFYWVDIREDADEPITDAVDKYQLDAQSFLNDHWRPVAVVGTLVLIVAIVVLDAPQVAAPNGRPRMIEPFAELLATPGVEEVCHLRGRFGFMAFHGGSLEEMTDVIAQEAAARSGASYYGVHQPKGLEWHIPSIKVTPTASPALAGFIDHVDVVVTVHGFGRRGYFTTLLLGGQNRDLAEHLGAELRSRLPAYEIATDLERIPSELRGLHDRNPVNLPRDRGVQIELPPRVRGTTPLFWDWEGPGLAPHAAALVDGLVSGAMSWPVAQGASRSISQPPSTDR